MKFFRNIPPGTRCLILVCAVIAAAVNLIPFTGNRTEAAILLGAYYKPMIIAGEYWRLLSCSLIHVSIYHLFVNMYSLLNLGTLTEKMMGTGRFLAVIFFSAFCGSLFLFSMAGNTVAVGLSGGLYGLMAWEFCWLYFSGGTRVPQIRAAIMRILFINLMINFLPGIAWQAHLGGAAGGILAGLALSTNDKKARYAAVSAAVILLAALGWSAVRNASVSRSQIYLLTDARVLQYEKEIGLGGHARKIAKRLDILYDTEYLENILE